MRQATAEIAINESLSSLKLIGGNDVLPDRLSKYPDLDVYGGARIRKNMVVMGDSIFRGETILEGNLFVLGNITLGDIIGDFDIDGNVDVTGSYFINGTKVVGDQQPDVSNVVVDVVSGSGDDGNINANFANVISTLNNALAVLRAHGLMA